jgi:uncharacterized cofD-like protein
MPLGRIVAMGGGTGLPAVLAALKPACAGGKGASRDLCAIVTVTDDGGSSGRLRRELGVLPPGDIRNCLLALSEAPEVMRKLFQYRFTQGDLEGHSLGNLLIVALAEVAGDFAEGVRHLHDILAIRGRILPSTLESVQLLAERLDGSVVLGEKALPAPGVGIRRLTLQPPDCKALPDAVAVLGAADLILLGPGSLYTSILPNLLVREIGQALRSAPGRKVYVCNLTTQPGETEGYKASDHVRALYSHVGPWVCDTVLCNDAPLPLEVAATYAGQGQIPVEVDHDSLESLGCRVVTADLLAEGAYARHDPAKLRHCLLSLAGEPQEVP